MAWDDEKKARAIQLYTEADPTPETSVEIVKEVAEAVGETVNGTRMILSKAEVYVKAAPAAKAGTATKEKAEGTKRVSKSDSIDALVAIIEGEGLEADREILDKLTGKQAVYLAETIKKML